MKEAFVAAPGRRLACLFNANASGSRRAELFPIVSNGRLVKDGAAVASVTPG
jgi:hypothetical protein